MKRSRITVMLARIAGIVILITGIRLIGEGIYNYIDEHRQQDWIFTTAHVIDVSEYVRSTATGRHRSRFRYNITYQYEVDGEEYADKLYNRSEPMGIGEAVTVKYDPDAPGDSTEILSPSLNNLLVFVGFGCALSVIGVFSSGLWALINWMRRKGLPEEEELPPEELIQPDSEEKQNQFPLQ